MRVALRGVTVTFGDTVALHEVDAEFHAGQVHAVVGPSGSGKSTLLGVVGALQRPDAGTVVLTRDDGATAPVTQDDVVWVPQGVNVLAGRTVLDNVMIGPFAAGASTPSATVAALAALRQVGLEQRAGSFARELSGGELQRVALARAVAARRPVMLIDEPTASLDEHNARAVAGILERLSTEAIVIVATHDEVVKEAADAVLHLRRE